MSSRDSQTGFSNDGVPVNADAVRVPPELLSRAFDYVTGALTSDEAASFETELDCDTRLCEAVVRATQLVAALSVSCEEFHRRQSSVSAVRHAAEVVSFDGLGSPSYGKRSSASRLTKTSFGMRRLLAGGVVGLLASSLLVAMLASSLRPSPGASDESTVQALESVSTEDADSMLAMYVHKSFDEQTLAAEFTDDGEVDAVAASSESSDAAPDVTGHDVSVPAWLLTAVILEGDG